jgi:hypothetical protein
VAVIPWNSHFCRVIETLPTPSLGRAPSISHVLWCESSYVRSDGFHLEIEKLTDDPKGGYVTTLVRPEIPVGMVLILLKEPDVGLVRKLSKLRVVVCLVEHPVVGCPLQDFHEELFAPLDLLLNTGVFSLFGGLRKAFRSSRRRHQAQRWCGWPGWGGYTV